MRYWLPYTKTRLYVGLMGAMLPVAFPGLSVGEESGSRQYYELRTYNTKTEEQQKLVNDYLQNAAVPAYNRMGIQPIGVFTQWRDSPTNKIYVLIPFDSLDIFAQVPGRLAADSTYQLAAAEYLSRKEPNPAYERIDSSLNVAFDSMKRLSVPASLAEKKPWVFELRIYQSPSEGKGINKVQMFNSGEVPLMQDSGLSPVFFAQALSGSQMPNLVYMVSGPNLEEHKKHWAAFFGAPAWKKLIGDPQYQGNVSSVMSIFLKRTAASQI